MATTQKIEIPVSLSAQIENLREIRQTLTATLNSAGKDSSLAKTLTKDLSKINQMLGEVEEFALSPTIDESGLKQLQKVLDNFYKQAQSSFSNADFANFEAIASESDIARLKTLTAEAAKYRRELETLRKTGSSERTDAYLLRTGKQDLLGKAQAQKGFDSTASLGKNALAMERAAESYQRSADAMQTAIEKLESEANAAIANAQQAAQQVKTLEQQSQTLGADTQAARFHHAAGRFKTAIVANRGIENPTINSVERGLRSALESVQANGKIATDARNAVGDWIKHLFPQLPTSDIASMVGQDINTLLSDLMERIFGSGYLDTDIVYSPEHSAILSRAQDYSRSEINRIAGVHSTANVLDLTTRSQQVNSDLRKAKSRWTAYNNEADSKVTSWLEMTDQQEELTAAAQASAQLSQELYTLADAAQKAAMASKEAQIQQNAEAQQDLKEGAIQSTRQLARQGKAVSRQYQAADESFISEVSENLKSAKIDANEAEQFTNNLKQSITHWMSAQQIINLVKDGIRQAYQDIKSLDAAMTNIAVVTDMSVSDLWGKINEYMSIAQQYGVTTQGVYEVSQLYYQQGLSTNEVMAATTETLKMARIAGMGYAEAADAMTVAIRSFKMEMSDAGHVTDVYSKVAAITASDSEELAIAMSKTASSAESVGSSFENTTAMLAVMVETTRESAQNLGSALKSIISRYGEMKQGLTQDSDGEIIDYNKTDAALRSIGISIKDAQGQFRDFDDVIFELSAKWNSLDKNTQRYIATIMAGNRQQSRFIALVDNWERLDEVATAAQDSEDAGLLQYAKTLDSLDTKINNLKTSFQEFYMNIVNGPLISGALEALNDLIQGFNKLGSLQGVFNLIGIIRGLKTGLKLIVNTFGSSFSNIISSWQNTQSQWLVIAKQDSYNRGREMARAENQGYIDEKNGVSSLPSKKLTQDDYNWAKTLSRKERKELGIGYNYVNMSDSQRTAAYNSMSFLERRQKGNQTGIIGKEGWKTNSWNNSGWGQGISTGGAIAGGILSTWGASVAEENPVLGSAVSGLGNVAQYASMGAVLGPWGAAAGAAVGAVIGLFDVLDTWAKRDELELERLKKEAEELNVERAKKTDEYKSLSNYVNALKEAEKNKNNSNEEYQEWLDLNNEIAEKYPELISYIDAEGNAIVSLTEDYAGLSSAKQEALEANSEYYKKQIETYKQQKKVLEQSGSTNGFLHMGQFITSEYIGAEGTSVGYGSSLARQKIAEDSGAGIEVAQVDEFIKLQQASGLTFSEYVQTEEGSDVYKIYLQNLNNDDDVMQLLFGASPEEITAFVREHERQVREEGVGTSFFDNENYWWDKDFEGFSVDSVSNGEALKIYSAYSQSMGKGQLTDYVKPELIQAWFSEGTTAEEALSDIKNLQSGEANLSDIVNSNLDIQKMLYAANYATNEDIRKSSQEALKIMGLAEEKDGVYQLIEAGKNLAELQKNKQAYHAALKATVTSQGSLMMMGTEYAKGLSEMAGAEEILLQRSIGMAGGVENLLDFEQSDEFSDIYGAGGYAQRLADWYQNLTREQQELYNTFINNSTSLSLKEAQDYLERMGIDEQHEFYQAMMSTWYQDNISAQNRAMRLIWGDQAGIDSYDLWLKSEDYTAKRAENDAAAATDANLYKTDQELYREAIESRLKEFQKDSEGMNAQIANIIQNASTDELNEYLNFYQETEELLKGAVTTRQKEALKTRRELVTKYVDLLTSGNWKNADNGTTFFGRALNTFTNEQADMLNSLLLSPDFGTEAWAEQVRAFGISMGISLEEINKQINSFLYENFNTKIEMLLDQIDSISEKANDLVKKQDKGYTFEEAQRTYELLKSYGIDKSIGELFTFTEDGLMVLANLDEALSIQSEFFRTRLTKEKQKLEKIQQILSDKPTNPDNPEEQKDSKLVEEIMDFSSKISQKPVGADETSNEYAQWQAEVDTAEGELIELLKSDEYGFTHEEAVSIVNSITEHTFTGATEVEDFFINLASETGLAVEYLKTEFGKINSDIGFNNFSKSFSSVKKASDVFKNLSLDNLRLAWDAKAQQKSDYETWSQDSNNWLAFYQAEQEYLLNNHIASLDAFGNLVVKDWEKWGEYIADSYGYSEAAIAKANKSGDTETATRLSAARTQILSSAKASQIALQETTLNNIQDGLENLYTSLIEDGEIEFSEVEDILTALQPKMAASDYSNLLDKYELAKTGTIQDFKIFIDDLANIARAQGYDINEDEIIAKIQDAYTSLVKTLFDHLSSAIEGSLSAEGLDSLELSLGLDLSAYQQQTLDGYQLSSEGLLKVAGELEQRYGNVAGYAEKMAELFVGEDKLYSGTEELDERIAAIEKARDAEGKLSDELEYQLSLLKKMRATSRLNENDPLFNFMDKDSTRGFAAGSEQMVASIDKVKSTFKAISSKEQVAVDDFYNMMDFMYNNRDTEKYGAGNDQAWLIDALGITDTQLASLKTKSGEAVTTYEDFVNAIVSGSEELGKVDSEVLLDMGISMDTMSESMSKSLSQVAKEQIKYLNGIKNMLLAMQALESLGDINIPVGFDFFNKDGKKTNQLTLNDLINWNDIINSELNSGLSDDDFKALAQKANELIEIYKTTLNDAFKDTELKGVFGQLITEMFGSDGFTGSDADISAAAMLSKWIGSLSGLDATEANSLATELGAKLLDSEGKLVDDWQSIFIDYFNNVDWNNIAEASSAAIQTALNQAFVKNGLKVQLNGTQLKLEEGVTWNEQLEASIREQFAKYYGDKGVEFTVNGDGNVTVHLIPKEIQGIVHNTNDAINWAWEDDGKFSASDIALGEDKYTVIINAQGIVNIVDTNNRPITSQEVQEKVLKAAGIDPSTGNFETVNGTQQFKINVTSAVQQGETPKQEVEMSYTNLDAWQQESLVQPATMKYIGIITSLPTITQNVIRKFAPAPTSVAVKGNVSSLSAGAALAQGTLMGELGPELYVQNGQYQIAGANGPEFVDLDPDAIVFNHLQTASLLGKGHATTTGSPVTSERRAVGAYATGNVSGLALANGSISSAIAAIDRAIAIWQNIANITAADLVGGGGGGGGGDNSIKAVTEELTKWYNLTRQIEKLEQDINNLLAERKNITDGGEYLRSLREQQQLLAQQAATQRTLLAYQEEQLERQQEHIKNNKIWSQFLTFDESGNLQYIVGNESNGGQGQLSVLEQLNKMSGEEQLNYIKNTLGYSYTDQDGNKLDGEDLITKFFEELQGQIDSYDALFDTVNSTEEKLQEIQSTMDEIDQEIEQNQMDLEQAIYDVIVDAWEKQIEQMEEQMELVQEANEAYIENLNKALSDERDMYSQNESIADRESLQNRLALLRRSGGSASEIYDLEQQLDSMLKDEYFNKQEKMIQNIEEASEEQIKKLEEQIKLEEEALEYQKENGVLWTQVYEIMQGTEESILAFMQGNSPEFFSQSTLQQKQMLTDWAKQIGIYTEDQQYKNYRKEAEDAHWDNNSWRANISEGGVGRELAAIFDGLNADQQGTLKNLFTSTYANEMLESGDEKEALKAAIAALKAQLKSIQSQQASAAAAASGGSGGNGSGGTGQNPSSGQKPKRYRVDYTVVFVDNQIKTGYGVGSSEYEALAAAKYQAKKHTKSPPDPKNNMYPGGAPVRNTNYSKAYAYKQGGLVDYTGPALVHGSPSKPEAFLNAKQTAMISEAVKAAGDGGALNGIKATLAALNSTIKGIVNNDNSLTSSFTVAPGAVTIQVAQLNDSYDVEELSKDVMNRMVAIASRTTNRGVNRR